MNCGIDTRTLNSRGEVVESDQNTTLLDDNNKSVEAGNVSELEGGRSLCGKQCERTENQINENS